MILGSYTSLQNKSLASKQSNHRVKTYFTDFYFIGIQLQIQQLYFFLINEAA